MGNKVMLLLLLDTSGQCLANSNREVQFHFITVCGHGLNSTVANVLLSWAYRVPFATLCLHVFSL